MSSFNQPQYKYIKSDVIVNEVKNLLSSYFDQGTLDESILYPKIRWCLDKMGMKVHPYKTAMIGISNKQGKLPLDFYKLNYAIGCGESEVWEDMNGLDQFVPRITEKRIYDVPACKSKFDYCTNECGETYEILQSFEQVKYRYWNFFEVKVSSSKESCSDNCPNINYGCQNDIAIRNGHVYTNFNGNVYIDYLGTMEDIDGDLLLVECLLKLFYNGENNVAQRLQLAEQILTAKQADFESFRRMNEVSDFYDLSRILISRYSKYKTAVKGNHRDLYKGLYLTSGRNQYT